MWLHPRNAELRTLRSDPAVLAEGDLVHVPDAPPRRFSGLRTRRVHDIVLHLPEPQLRLALLRTSGIAYAAVRTRVTFDGEVQEHTPDAGGLIELLLDVDTEELRLEYDNQRVALRVAHLQPVDHHAGWHARLENLGYDPGPLDAETASDKLRLRSAIEEFQCDHGLAVDGVVGEKTMAKLLEVHGA